MDSTRIQCKYAEERVSSYSYFFLVAKSGGKSANLCCTKASFFYSLNGHALAIQNSCKLCLRQPKWVAKICSNYQKFVVGGRFLHYARYREAKV